MSWAKFDDRYDDNRKVKKAWRKNRAAIGLHAMAITYSCRHRTDGLVDVDWMEEKLPHERERSKTVTTLIAFGLFEAVDGEHWRVHDFLDYNASRQSRQESSEAAKRAADARWDAERNADPHAESSADGMRTAMPLPSPPDPTETETPPDPAEGKVEHPPDTAEGVAGEVIGVLRKQSRFGPISALTYETGILSLAAAHPDKEIVKAAHEAVAIASDPAWRMTNPLGCLRFCLDRQKPGERPAELSGQNVVTLNRKCARCKTAQVEVGYGAYCEPCSEAIA